MLAKFKPLAIFATVAMALNLVFGLSDVFNHGYWNLGYLSRLRAANDQIVVVSLDSGAVNRATPTAHQARLLETIDGSEPKQVLFDFPSEAGIDPAGDMALRTAIERANSRIALVNRSRVDSLRGVGEIKKPTFAAPDGVPVVVSNWTVNFASYFERSQGTFQVNGVELPAAAAFASSESGARAATIYPDFRIDAQSIKVLDADTIRTNPTAREVLRGKTVFVTRTALDPAKTLGFFGNRRLAPVYADIAGMHGLARGTVRDLGGLPLLALVIAALLAGRFTHRRAVKIAIYFSAVMVLLIVPMVVMEARVIATPGYAMVALLVYVPSRIWQKWRKHVALTSAASGLPNIEALATQGIASSHDVVAASISHYEQMMASLPRELHGECARQIARRLSIASGESQVFDTDNGHFVWLTQPYSTDALVAQLEGLKALFAAPLLIKGHVLDTNVHFGLDRNSESTPMSRIKSAIVGSTEAQSKGKLYEEFGSKRLAETQWELSLHARIDEALRNGDIWLAFQAQYDFKSNEISSAEILIRWTDPERGPIPPDSFILQAERAGRIDALTYWVLEQSILASKLLASEVGTIRLGVNLSAWMVDQPSLVQNITEIVRRHHMDCSLLTFEVTETFSMSNRELAKRNLAALRAMGFRLSIDDFGTGQSGLAYLAEIPSDELKLDKRFVQAIVKSKRERSIVSNTIRLAHDLGQEVVAEGVEDLAVLEVLRNLGCDIAQGYYIGRPVRLVDFLAELKSQRFDARRFG